MWKKESLFLKTYKSRGVFWFIFAQKTFVMKFFALFFLCTVSLSAQQALEMTPQGFAPITLDSPSKPLEKLIEAATAWAPYYNKKGYDVYDVSANSITIDAWKDNAYFYRNLGERYDYNIKYSLKVVFNADKTYTLTFAVKDIYAKKVLVQTTVADFFTPDGKLKEDFLEVKPSLENTADKIVKSFAEFIVP
jgi:hypothetical protein